MRRWHQERSLMLARLRFDREFFGEYRKDRKMGHFRKRKPLDCGKTRCCSCHWEKYVDVKSRRHEKYRAIKLELELG